MWTQSKCHCWCCCFCLFSHNYGASLNTYKPLGKEENLAEEREKFLVVPWKGIVVFDEAISSNFRPESDRKCHFYCIRATVEIGILCVLFVNIIILQINWKWVKNEQESTQQMFHLSIMWMWVLLARLVNVIPTEHKIYKRFSFSFSLILVNLIHGVCVVCQTESTTSAISETFRLFDLIGWINKIHYINKLYLCGNLKGDYMLHSTTAAWASTNKALNEKDFKPSAHYYCLDGWFLRFGSFLS